MLERIRKFLAKHFGESPREGVVSLIILTAGSAMFLTSAMFAHSKVSGTIAATSANVRIQQNNLTTALRGAFVNQSFCASAILNGVATYYNNNSPYTSVSGNLYSGNNSTPQYTPVPTPTGFYGMAGASPNRIGLASIQGNTGKGWNQYGHYDPQLLVAPSGTPSGAPTWNMLSLQAYNQPGALGDGITLEINGVTPHSDTVDCGYPGTGASPGGDCCPTAGGGKNACFYLDGAYIQIHVHRMLAGMAGTFLGPNDYYVQLPAFDSTANPQRPFAIDPNASDPLLHCNL